jgi:hypothetical protein
MKRMRHSSSETNPTTAHSHDGQCQGVTPFFFLKLSEDVYATTATTTARARMIRFTTGEALAFILVTIG